MEEKLFTDDRMPITKEFLEKNGFHGQDDYYYYVIADLSKTDSFWSIKIIFATEHPTYITQIEIENVVADDVINISMSTIGGKIYFVHELQHAIKLSEINLNLK